MKNIKEAIILSGGQGTRLRSITQDKIPKVLLKICDKPILEWQLYHLLASGVEHTVFASRYKNELIRDYFGNEFEHEGRVMKISYSIEKDKLGSGGAVKLASEFVSSDIFILNGDILTNADLSTLIKIHYQHEFEATMLTTFMKSPYGIVKTENHNITKFEEKPILDVLIHAGIDLVNYDVLCKFPEAGQMEDTIFPELAKARTFGHCVLANTNYWRSIDTEKDYIAANRDWKDVQKPIAK